MGFLFLILYPASSSSSASASASAASSFSTTISYTLSVSFTHIFVNHHLSHTIFHTQACQPPSLTHIQPPSLTHTSLSHTIFHTQPHTIFHTQLCQPPSLAHIFVTHHLQPPSLTHIFVNHHLSHTIFVTHQHLATYACVLRGRRGTWRHLPSFCASTTMFHTQLCQPPSLTHIFVTHQHLATYACVIFVTHQHLATYAWVLRGRRRTWRHLPSFCAAGVLQLALGGALGRRWSSLVAGEAAALCVAGAALGDIYLRFTWQAWHLVTFHVAGVALGDIYLRFAWQACYRLHLVSRLAPVGRGWSPVMPRHFAWQAWHLETSTFVLRGRRATACSWWRAWSQLVAVVRR